MKRILVFCITAVMIVCLSFSTACEKNKTPSEHQGDDKAVVQGLSWFIENGHSDYKIVVGSEVNDEVTFAKEELIYFVNLITGCKLEIISDKVAADDSKAKYISIGRNELLAKKDVNLKEADVGNSGYIIRSFGNTVCITGDGAYDYGTIFGVYGFLNRIFGLKIYAGDCFDYRTEKNVKMPAFDICYRPDTDRVYFNVGSYNYLEATRLGLINVSAFSPSRAVGHSMLSVMKSSPDYIGKDWLTPDGGMICFSATEMYPVFARNLINLIIDSPEYTRFFIGQEDMVPACSCDRCMAMRKKYHTNYAGLMMIFFRNVLDIVYDYFEKNMPDRIFEVSTYAYEDSLEPPAHKNENGEFVPDDPAVIAHPKLKVMFTAIDRDNNFRFDEPKNKMVDEALKGWGVIATELENYGYNYYTRAGTVTPGTFNTFSDTIRRLHEAGCTFYYEEGPVMWSNLVPLRIYVQSRLCKAVSLSYDEVAYDFIEHYYGPAAGAMKNFYDLYKTYYAENRENMPGACQDPPTGIYSTKSLSEAFMNTQIKLLEDANRAIEDLKQTDYELYDTYLWRIRREEFTARANRLHIYSTTMSASKIKEEVELIQDWPNVLPGGKRFRAPGSGWGGVVTYDKFFADLLK